jgi:hypothetical protein
VRPAVERTQARLLAPLSAEEQATFLALLTRLVDHNNTHSRAPQRPLERPDLEAAE